MPKYEVEIEARITKWISVEAKDLDEARNEAYEQFDASFDGQKEYFETDVVQIREVTP